MLNVGVFYPNTTYKTMYQQKASLTIVPGDLNSTPPLPLKETGLHHTPYHSMPRAGRCYCTPNIPKWKMEKHAQ